jgi:tripartite ATP-independent transporter DctM subunit
MLLPLLGLFFLFSLLGMPIAFAIGLSGALTFIFCSDIPSFVIAQKMVGGIDSFPLLAAPYFILAGMCMESGGISKRLVNFANCLVGSIRGGLSQVAIVAGIIFAGISGSGVADASAIGAVLIPPMTQKKYKPGFSAALIAASGSIGMIIPPSLLMIVYGSLTGISIGELFLGGIIPGLIIGIGLMAVAYWYALHEKHEVEGTSSLKELWASFKSAFWALLTPVIIVGGIVSGVFTATEAGAVAALYAFGVSFFIYKELKLKDLKKVFVKAAAITSSVLIILSYASIFGYIMAVEHVPSLIQNFLLSFSADRYVILFMILGFLVILGCFIETLASMIILVPILVPIGAALHFDPIQFGVLMIIALNLGGITPPLGILLLLTTGLAETTLSQSSKYIGIFVAVFLFAMLLLAYLPEAATFIPKLLLD